jgi:outer membrane protein
MTGVVNAIEVLAETQSQYSSVRHQLVLDRLLLKQAAGTLDVKDLEATNRLLE